MNAVPPLGQFPDSDTLIPRFREAGDVTLDLTTRRFTAGGQTLDLPPRERALLELLFTRAGKVVAKDAIITSLSTWDESLSDNAIEQYVSRLRRRIAPYGIDLRTARGLGYFIDKDGG